jgi:hypothetical protein
VVRVWAVIVPPAVGVEGVVSHDRVLSIGKHI